MAQLEFGIRKGLAIPLIQDRSQELLQGYALTKQATTAAEAKAKLFADDFEYQNAMNSYDNPIIKDVAKKMIYDAGVWMRDNPGWEKDVSKRIEWNQKMRGLKDHPDLMRGYQTDVSMKEHTAWMLKNPELANSEQGIAIQKSKQAYLDAASGTNKQPWTFVPPEDVIDTTARAAEIFGKSKAHGFESYNQKGFIGGTRQFVTTEDKLGAAEALLTDKDGKWFKAEWNKLPEEQKALHKNDPRQYLIDKYGLFFAKDEYDKGSQPINRPSAKPAVPQKDLFHENLNNSKQTPGVPVQSNSDGVSGMFSDNNGNYNFNNAVTINSKGNITRHSPMVFSKNQVITGGSKTIFIPDATTKGSGKNYTSATIQVPVDEFIQNNPDGEKIIDMPTYGTGWIPGNEPVISKEYNGNNYFIKKVGDKDVVEYEIWNQVDDNQQNADAYNFSAHGKPSPYGVEGNNQNTQTFTDEVGNIFISDGQGGYIPYNQ